MRNPGSGAIGLTLLACALANWASPVGAPLLGSPISVAHAQDSDAFVTVEVEGFGSTADDARKNALRVAVQEAVGTLVDEETAIANDKLISDAVLTYSDGLVERFETLQEPTPDKSMGGIYRCRIRAVVKRGDVAKRLDAIPMVSSAVAGDQLWAQSLSKIQGVEDGRKLLTEFFKRRPLHRLLVARVVDKNGNPAGAMGLERAPNYDKGTTKLSFGVQTFEDTQTYYTRYAAPLTALLDRIGKLKDASVTLDSSGSTASIQVYMDKAPAGMRCVSTRGMEGVATKIHEAASPDRANRHVVITTGRNADATNLRLRVYTLEANAYDERSMPDSPFVWHSNWGRSELTYEALHQIVTLRVSLIDAGGRTVQVKNISPTTTAFEDGHAYYVPGAGFLGPTDLASGWGVICSSIITPVQIEIPNDDLRNVASIAVEIVPASAR